MVGVGEGGNVPIMYVSSSRETIPGRGWPDWPGLKSTNPPITAQFLPNCSQSQFYHQ